MLKPYELVWLTWEPFLPVLYQRVCRDLKKIVKSQTHQPLSILDVGGRKSPYTIGLPAQITILDIPRRTEIQEGLSLGLTDHIVNDLKKCRSNINQVVLQDMVECSLPSESFDGVVCVEVIEHIKSNEEFIKQIQRVLKPGGWLYLTTPNGDYLRNEPPNYNPDHFILYTRMGLTDLLSRYFENVQVVYGVKTGKYRVRGLQSLNFRKPIQNLQTAMNNLINYYQSQGLENQPRRTAHLFATAMKMQ